MKKLVSLMLISALLLLTCSCGNVETSKVIEIGNSSYADGINHKNELTETTVTTIDNNKIGSKKIIDFCKKQYNAVYDQTVNYVIGDVTADVYNVENTKEKIILLPDDTIYAILLDDGFAKIDIEPNSEKEYVKEKVVTLLKDVVNFDSFEYCDIKCSLEDISDGFGLYSFIWYNKKGEMPTDQSLQLCVKQSGEVGALWMKYNSGISYDNVPDNFGADEIKENIENKLTAIYGKKLNDFSVSSYTLTRYQNNNWVDCTVSVHYMGDNQEVCSEACRLLVPVE